MLARNALSNDLGLVVYKGSNVIASAVVPNGCGECVCVCVCV